MTNIANEEDSYILRRGVLYKRVNEKVVINAIEKYRGTLAGKKERLSDEEICSELDLVNEQGILHLYKNVRIKKVLLSRAFHYQTSLEEEIRKIGYTRYTKIEKSPNRGTKIAREKHLANLKDCINENGEIVNLSKEYPLTYGYMLLQAKKHQMPLEDYINSFVGVPAGTYKYVKYSSAYDFNSSNFIAEDPVVFAAVQDTLHELMDDEHHIYYMQDRAPQLYNIFAQISVRNNVSVEDAIHIFTPEAEYGATPGVLTGYVRESTTKIISDQEIAHILESNDDGSGFVDSIRENAYQYNLIKRRAIENSMTIDKYIKKFGFRFAQQYYEVDHEDYLRTMLRHYYGKAPCQVSKISLDYPQLYRRLTYFRHFYPGNVFPTNQSLMEFFGYDFKGRRNNIDTLTLVQVKDIIENKFDKDKPVVGVWMDDKVWRPIVDYCSQNAISMKDLFDSLGYDYNGTGVSNFRSKLYLKPDEYKLYMKLSEEYAKERADSQPIN